MTTHLKKTSVKLLQFADDTTLIGLIQDGDESAYRQEVKELAVWCSLNNLELNMLKTVEMIVDFWRKGLAQSLSLDPHIQHTPSFNCYHLVDATELWAPERPDTETVSFPKQSISWTLDIKRGTHNTIIQLLIHHKLIFSF